MFEKIKEFDKLLDQRFEKYRFPGYLSKNLFRISAALMFLLLFSILWQQNWHLYAIDVSCSANSPTYCRNPLFDCNTYGYTYDAGVYTIADGCQFAQKSPPQWVCDVVPCDKLFLAPGESYSNAGWLIRHGMLLVLSLIVGTFVLNAIIYRIKYGTWKYVRSNHV